MSSKDGREKSPILVGPWGGKGGSPWSDGAYTTVRQLVILHGAAVDSIRVEYDWKGSSIWSEKHGGESGVKTDKVNLEYPQEFLISVSGHYGSLSNGGPVIIRSLTFESNHSKYGPFGFEQGMHFSFPMSGAKIVGFHGRSGLYLDSIGFYLRQLKIPNPSNALIPSQGLSTYSAEKIGYSGLEGPAARKFDIVLAVRERGDNYNVVSTNYTTETPSSQEFRDFGTNHRVSHFPSYSAEKGSTITEGPTTYGPWGGSGGTIFDDGMYTGVRRINLTRGVGITAIKVQYDKNGHAVWGNKQGGSGGIISDKIVFDYPFEILTHISGYFGAILLMGPTAVKSLTFHTTKRKYGPYGDEQGMFFSSRVADGKIVGFHGRGGWYIDSIGVLVLEGKVSLSQPLATEPYKGGDMAVTAVDKSYWSKNLPAASGIEEEVNQSVVKEPVPVGPGPWGGDGGKPWDDGVYSGIRQLYITRKETISSIQIEYDRSGQSVWSARHGSDGETAHRIKLEYPNEVLNCISGYYSITRDNKHKVVKSLTFYTSRGKYGPFGEELGTYFTSTTTEGKVVGFHG